MSKLFRRKSSGQAAMELAVFGAVVIFVIGMILRIALRTSQSVNTDLRVFRMALAESFRTGRGGYSHANVSSARNSAALLVVEDRLAIDSAQAVTRDRWPIIAQATATMSPNILMEFNPEHAYNLSVFDLIINGQRFPLTSARFVRIELAPLRDSSGPQGIAPCNSDDYGPGRGACYYLGTNILDEEVYRYRFFRKIYNYTDKEWCHGASCSPPADLRFDFDFDGTPDVLAGETFPWGFFSENLRRHYAWQWYPVAESELLQVQYADITGNFVEEFVRELHREELEDVGEELWLYDLENDGELTHIDVLDYTAGDLDFGAQAMRSERVPGLQPDMVMYSETRQGVLENREGRLVDGSGRFVRNATRQDQLDIIERTLFLSNDTGRFCSGGSPTAWGGSHFAGLNGLRGLTNPVQVCANDCYSPANITRTCMDPGGPTIYVRGRVRDRRETIWSTRTRD